MSEDYDLVLDLALQPGTNKGGLEKAPFDEALSAVEPGLHALASAGSGRPPVLDVAGREDDLPACVDAAAALARGARDIVIFGTGGSSLGGQTLAQLAGWQVPGVELSAGPDACRLHFFDNLDHFGLTTLLRDWDLKTTRFLVISKSGTTAETLMQCLLVIDGLKDAGLDWNLAQHMLFVTEPAAPGATNTLRAIAEHNTIPVLDHDPGVGGRFAVLTNVGLIPAALAGLDIQAIRAGAQSIIDLMNGKPDPHDFAPARGAALQWGLQRHNGVGNSILLAYSDRLRAFSNWYVQLWSESLGKQGRGTMPVAATGPLDQHSQLQMWLDGPADKLITIVAAATANHGPRVSQALARDSQLGYLAGRSVGDLVDAQCRATAATLAEAGRPVRLFRVPELNERSMGALLMHFMVETILMARLLGVDPFDQPAVEKGKILVRRDLESR